MLGPLTFNVFLCDFFPFKPNIDLISYADDKTLFAMGGSSELGVINEIKGWVENLTLWFRNNCFNEITKQKSFCILKDLIDRGSHRKCSVRKGVLRNFAKLTGKHLRQSFFLNKVASFSLQLH